MLGEVSIPHEFGVEPGVRLVAAAGVGQNVDLGAVETFAFEAGTAQRACREEQRVQRESEQGDELRFVSLDKAAHTCRPALRSASDSAAADVVARDTVETRPSPQSSNWCSSLGSRRLGVNPDSCNRRQNGLLGDENEYPMLADWLDGLIATIKARRRGPTRSPNGPRSGSACSLIDATIRIGSTLTREWVFS